MKGNRHCANGICAIKAHASSQILSAVTAGGNQHAGHQSAQQVYSLCLEGKGLGMLVHGECNKFKR